MWGQAAVSASPWPQVGHRQRAELRHFPSSILPPFLPPPLPPPSPSPLFLPSCHLLCPDVCGAPSATSPSAGSLRPGVISQAAPLPRTGRIPAPSQCHRNPCFSRDLPAPASLSNFHHRLSCTSWAMRGRAGGTHMPWRPLPAVPRGGWSGVSSTALGSM